MYASEYLCDGETKFPIEQSDHFNLSLGHESITKIKFIYLLCTNRNDKIYLWGDKNSFNKAFEDALAGTGLFIATPNW